MINQDLAEILYKMAVYLDMLDGENTFFKSRALRKGAEIIENFPYDFADPTWSSDINKLIKIDGIGKSIAEHIQEFVNTGKVEEFEELKKNSPIKLEELLRIQGLGPKKIKRLYLELGVTDIESLTEAANNNLISNLSGFGPKSQQNILDSINFAIVNKDRIPLVTADRILFPILNYLKLDSNIQRIQVAGSYRRRKETVADFDILISSKNPVATIKHFVSYPNVEKILGEGETKSSVWLKEKFQCDLRIVPDESFPFALQYFTGSKEHNIAVRRIAISRGYKLSEYGLYDRKTDAPIDLKTEDELYNKLGMAYIEPELREDNDEIIASINSYRSKHDNNFDVKKLHSSPTLPASLLTQNDIKMDFHMHTVWSDGNNTVEEMAIAGKNLGYKKIGISDHFSKPVIANPIKEDRFNAYLKEIRNTKVDGITILAGCECEVDVDGNLEFDYKLLEQLDYVIAGIHLSTGISKEAMTKRIVNVLKNPLVKILAHPTGRLLMSRPGYDFDVDEVFKVAREENVALEINAHPARLDLNDKLVKKALEMGCKIAINTDAHSILDLKLIKYGVDVARRGWMEKDDLFEL